MDELDQDEAGEHWFAPGASAVTLSVILRHREAAWLVAGMEIPSDTLAGLHGSGDLSCLMTSTPAALALMVG